MLQEHYLRKKSNILCKNRKDVKPEERLSGQFKTTCNNKKARCLANRIWQQEILIYDLLLAARKKLARRSLLPVTDILPI